MTETPSEGKYLSPLVSCLECRAVKSAKGIVTHHIISHTEEGNKKHKETSEKSAKLGGKAIAAKCKKETEEKIYLYTKNPKVCGCGQKVSFEKRNNRFCSQSCAAHFSNSRKSNEQISKRLSSLRKTLKHKQESGKLQKMCKISFCVECGILIRNKNVKTCSKECSTQLRIKIGTHAGKSSASKRKDQRRSKDEIKLYNLCSEYFTSITHNDNSIANGWDADILIYDHNVAIMWNGPWHYKEMGFSNHSLKQVQNRDQIKIKEFEKVGWTVEIFEDRYYTPESAFNALKKKYGSP